MIKKYLIAIYWIACLAACSTGKEFYLKTPGASSQRITGTVFYRTVATWQWRERDSLAVQEILSGNIPGFLKKFVPVSSRITDSTGLVHHAVFYVSPDYLSIGTNEDWARIPLTPMAAQRIADRYNCFLPTRKIVDLIYQQAIVKPEPVPMSAYRDSSITMWQHHLLIEAQRKGSKGLIAGIKKDVVISTMVSNNRKPDRVAIYGWHLPDGKPIQPLYSGHVNWYVDYSHGIRLIYRKIKVDGKEMDYTDVLKDPLYQALICDEPPCSYFRYPY
ncbi:MAG TPA: hypothetical protein VK489_04110 [Ferruginibacter sp.]|nr:hypothetical protein [Ferruginibacter sp.]